MPVHGEAAHLRAHAKLAKQTGVDPKNIFICENGESLELTQEGVRRGEVVQSGLIYVDGLSVGDTSQMVLDERSALAGQGVAVIAAAISVKNHSIVGDTVVEMRGIPGGDDEYLCEEVQSCVHSSIKRALEKGKTGKELRKASRDALLSLLWERTKQRPMVIANLLEV